MTKALLIVPLPPCQVHGLSSFASVQCETFTQEVATSSEALQAARTKATELKRIVQSLEIELQMLQSTVGTTTPSS